MALRKSFDDKSFNVLDEDYYHPQFNSKTPQDVREFLRTKPVGSYLVFAIDGGENLCVAVKKSDSTASTSVSLVFVKGNNPSFQVIHETVLSVFKNATRVPLITPCCQFRYRTAAQFFDDCKNDLMRICDYLFQTGDNEAANQNREKLELLLIQIQPEQIINEFINVIKNHGQLGRYIVDKLWTKKIRKIVAENISLKQLYELYSVSPRLCNDLDTQVNFPFHFLFHDNSANDNNWHRSLSSRFVIPKDLVILMNLAQLMGNNDLPHQMIACSPDLQEIIQIHELPEKFPQLFGRYKKHEVTELGVKLNGKYHSQVLEALGKAFLEVSAEFGCRLIPQAAKRWNNSYAYIELGKLCLDHINKREIRPSEGLVKLLALALNEKALDDFQKSAHKGYSYTQSDLNHYNRFFERCIKTGQDFFSTLFPLLPNTPETFHFIAIVLYEACAQLHPENKIYRVRLEDLRQKKKEVMEQPFEVLQNAIKHFNVENHRITSLVPAQEASNENNNNVAAKK